MHMINKSGLFVTPALVTLIFLMAVPTTYAAEPPSFEAKVGDPKKITFKLTSNVDRPQPFVYIIQVKNEDGFTEQLSWVHGVLHIGQEIGPQQSWVPDEPGEHTIDIFVWESLMGSPLSPSLLMKVNVEA